MRAVRWAMVGMLGLWVGTLVGCGRPAPVEDGSPARVFRVAVIPKGSSHDFWFSVRAGAEKADAELDDLEITWKGPVSEGDTADQIQIVESFIANAYDGICLAPLDAVALRKQVDQAQANNIPVVIFDSALADQRGIVSYVATNNERGGRVAGEYLAKLLEGRGNVILMRYNLNSQSTEERERGFLEALAGFPEIKLLESEKHAGPDEAGAIALGEQLVANYGSEMQGIFCPNQSTASGMLTVLRRANLAGKVKFVGFDAGENIAQGIAKGEMQGTVLQDPVKMGYEAVRTIYDHLHGRRVADRVEISETLATTENAQDEDVRKLLDPPTSQ